MFRVCSRLICAVLAGVLLINEIIFPIQASAISDPLRYMAQDAWAIDDQCQTSAGLGSKTSGSNKLDKVYVVGDSITQAAKTTYEQQLKAAGATDVKVVASGGGNLSSPGTAGDTISGYDALSRDKDYIKTASTIIIAYGTNQLEHSNANGGYDSGYVARAKDSIARAVSLVKSSGTSGSIYWVDVAISTSAPSNVTAYAGFVDQAIHASDSSYKVIPWSQIVDPNYTPASATGPVKHNSTLLQSDGIHPTADGSNKLVAAAVDTVKNGSSSQASSNGGGDLQSIANDAVETGRKQGVDVAIKVSGDSSASAGETGQMPSASVIKLLVAAALAKQNVPLAGVHSDLDLMISNSDNTAANRLIDKAGGFGAINATADSLGIGADAHIGRKMLASRAGGDPNTISSKGVDSLLNEIKQSSSGNGKISRDYASAIIDAMKRQTIATKWGASGIPSAEMAHKTGELEGAQHDVGFFIKGDKWLTVTTMTNEAGGDGSKGVAIVKNVAKQLYDAWTGGTNTQSSDDGAAASCCVTPGVESVALAGNNNVEKILNFYMRKGLNLAQAAGIVGNMMQESGLKPNIVQGGRTIGETETYTMQNGVGFGLVQWTFTGRQKPLQEHIDKLGVKNTDLGGQLSFTWVELTGPYLSTLNNLKRTNNPVEAAVVVHDGYEKSADSDAEVRSVRGGNATKVYNQYKNAPALAGSTASSEMNNPSGEDAVDEHGQQIPADTGDSGGGGCSSSAGGNFEQTLKAYAWPEYKGMTIQSTDAYASAVKKASSSGLYVGGIAHKGIDCGGFVTLLVRDSGYDKGYNYDGKGGPTSSQEAWMKQHWQALGSSSSITEGTLKPGDVAINSSHTFIYVGDVPGFKAKIASASLDERAPMADNQQSPTQPGYNWYRKK